jgi:antitoxin component YwqK of YwqJK toxin-antitoxin module
MEMAFSEHPVRSVARLTISFFFLLAFFSCREKEMIIEESHGLLPADDINFKNQNGVLLYDHQNFNGTIFTLYPNGDTSALSTFKQGLPHGQWKQFYQGGMITETRYFDHGKKTGDFTRWWESGQVQSLYVFEDDEYHGTCREWNEQGLLVREMNYRKGHEEGMQTWWYDNGKIKSNYRIIEGRRYGLLGTKNCINVSDSIFNN